jgi:hypothetical protein
MPIALSLIGHLELGDRKLSRSEARDWLARAAVWFEGVGDAVLDTRLMRDGEDRPVLLVDLHPVSPPVEIRLRGSGKVQVSAQTTPTGPGYHQHLCEIFHQLAADFGFSWHPDSNDPTDYFFSRSTAAVEQQFLRWLAGACARSPAAIGLPAAHGFTYPAEVLTPLGPRTWEWARSVVEEPHRGGEFFAWWFPDLDAAFYRNRAVARMWSDFPWRPPLTDAEGEMADQIANDLATAFKLAPDAELPWTEWLELLDAIQTDAAGDQFCVTPTDTVLSIELWKRAGPVPGHTGPRIGYRRHPVRAALDGGWSIEIPGSFAREWDDERNWTGWDCTRTVWFRRVGFTKANGAPPTARESLEVGRRSLPEGEPVVPPLEAGEVRGEAVFGPVDEDGRTVWRLSGVAGVGGQLAVCNVYTQTLDDREWAVQTWRSLRHSHGT